VAAVIGAGIIPAGLEMMDKPMTAAVEDFVHAGYDLSAAAILLCESDGTPEEVEEEIARMSEVLRAAGATQIAVSTVDEAERLRFWSGRKNAFPASGRISPDYMCMDSTIPRKRLADILLAIQEMEKEVRPALLQCVPRRRRQPAPADPVRRQRPRPVAPRRAVRRRHPGDQRGHGRHGDRRARRGGGKAQQHVRAVLGRRERADDGVKHAFDPRGLLNPGKVIPTLQRCAEYGRMLVRGGRLPHAELERF
jgi:glycolate oxidase